MKKKNTGEQQNGRLQISSRKLEISRELFLQRMNTIKDRNGKDLTEADKISKGWQEYIKQLYKKGLNDADNHNSERVNFQAG